MTGNVLLDFFIGVILLVAVVAVFFLTVDKIVKDALLIKIGKIVVGALALVILIIAAWGALFGGARGGGAVISGQGLVYFAVGFLIVIAVVFVIDRVIAYFGFMVMELQYLLGLVALIAVLLLAGDALFGGKAAQTIGGHLTAPGPIVKER